ncbi:hypothetical protein HAX54_035546, partial [Datura stramonium]|nr:hypothetical protein [Datura stramonium]
RPDLDRFKQIRPKPDKIVKKRGRSGDVDSGCGSLPEDGETDRDLVGEGEEGRERGGLGLRFLVAVVRGKGCEGDTGDRRKGEGRRLVVGLFTTDLGVHDGEGDLVVFGGGCLVGFGRKRGEEDGEKERCDR